MKKTSFKTARQWNWPSILWKHLSMMLSILLLAVMVLLVIHQISMKTLTEENLSKIQRALERDCQQLDSEMFMDYVLPGTLENTYYYSYLRDAHETSLPERLMPILPILEDIVANETSLVGCSDLTTVYLCNVNATVTAGMRCFADAEDCFRDGIEFPETGTQVLLGYLRQKGSLTVLPVQPVRIGKERSQRCLPVILHPLDRNTAVLSLYTEQTLLEKLGMNNLPEGTSLELISRNEQVLLQYPLTGRPEADCYEMRCDLEKLPFSVIIQVPKQYFRDQLRPLRNIGLSLILFVVLAGGALAFFLSVRSVKPIRQLISVHGGETGRRDSDEIQKLDQLLSSASQRSQQLQEKLCRQILARVMTGAVLNEADELQLQLGGLLPEMYRAAIVHTDPDTNSQLGARIKAQVPELTWVYLSRKETGVVLTETALEPFMNVLNAMEDEISCGISGSAVDISSLPVTVHQARISLPEEGVKLFCGEGGSTEKLSWLQHERLYQCIFSCGKEETLQVLRAITERVDYRSARAAYYNILFILESAASELELQLPESSCDYQESRLPQENMDDLYELLERIYEQLEQRRSQQKDQEIVRILDYVTENAFDPELCAASAAQHFRVTEKRIYDAVRQGTGRSFNKNLLELRMKRAAELLCTTQTAIPQIGEMCGYQNNSTFYKAFKLYYGTAPGSFRKADAPDSQDAEN